MPRRARNVTGILKEIDRGEPQAAEELLPLVYDELRKLAAAKLAHEKPGQTLEATALVHEAYLRLVECEHKSPASTEKPGFWASRGHFFGAAAEHTRRWHPERLGPLYREFFANVSPQPFPPFLPLPGKRAS